MVWKQYELSRNHTLKFEFWSFPRTAICFMTCTQLLSHFWLYVIPWTAACQASLSFTISWNLLKFMSIELVMPSNHCILYQPRLLLSSIFPSIDVFSKELALHIERLFLNHEKTLGFLASGGEEFNPGPETRFDRSELLCNKVLLKYKWDKASDIGIRRGRKSTPC